MFTKAYFIFLNDLRKIQRIIINPFSLFSISGISVLE